MDLDQKILARRKRQLQRVLVGALLAISVFLIEVGASEILLARYNQCRRLLLKQRLYIDPYDLCLEEWQHLMLEATTGGVLGLFRPEANALAAWFVMMVLYAFVGGVIARLPLRWALGLFFALNIASIALLAGFSYLTRFIG
jgi:hypothetical protein